MRKYVHYLEINLMENLNNELNLLRQLKDYKDKTNSEVEIFIFNNSFRKIYKLTCNQSYRDLELPVNSNSISFIRHSRKPNCIKSARILEDYIIILKNN